MTAGFFLLACSVSAAASGADQIATEVQAGQNELIEKAWKAIDEAYYDPAFGGVDWDRLGKAYKDSDYHTVAEEHDAIRRMVSELGNPSTRFLTPGQAKALLAELDGNLGSGVGLIELLSIDIDEGEGGITVVTPIADTPAARSGLKSGDRVLQVNGVPVTKLDLAALMERLRGPAGSVVELSLERNGETHVASIEREGLGPVDAVVSRILAVEGLELGYLGLRLFTPAASEELRAEISRMEAAGVDVFLLDLRNNPGGRLTAVREIAGAFLGEAPLASMTGRDGEKVLTALGRQLTDRPLVVLINEGTASAAEILASALRHHRRAKLIGGRSFGKGLAHGYVALADGSGVMYTTGRIKTLSGDDLLTQGLAPDLMIDFGPHPVVEAEIAAAGPKDVEFAAAVSEARRLFLAK